MNRRKFIHKTLISVTGVFALGCLPQCARGGELSSSGSVTASLEDLAGEEVRASSNYRWYLGLSGELPETASFDFSELLTEMWERKNRRYPGNRSVEGMMRDIIPNYSPASATRLNLREYLETAQEEVEHFNEIIDWNEVRNRTGLTAPQLELVQRAVSTIDGYDLLAYAMTELFDLPEGRFNCQVFDFLLSNAGREYVELIPAMGDDRTSFGPFQFTSYALHDLPGDVRGASIINYALPSDERIPGSVSLLEGNDHFRAAWLFSVYNICELVAGLDQTQGESLAGSLERNSDAITLFIAGAHHAPGNARRYAERWRTAGGTGRFRDYCQGRVSEYVEKTFENLQGLRG